MQQKNAAKCSWAERLESYRVKTQKTWKQVGADLGLSDSMLYQVKRGEVGLSPKALHRLSQAEKMAGIGFLNEVATAAERAANYAGSDQHKEGFRDGQVVAVEAEARAERAEQQLARVRSMLAEVLIVLGEETLPKKI